MYSLKFKSDGTSRELHCVKNDNVNCIMDKSGSNHYGSEEECIHGNVFQMTVVRGVV